jgi:hypothetical protein
MQTGDRVRFSSKFLRSISEHTGRRTTIKGTFVGPFPGLEKSHGYVHWDDEAERIAGGQSRINIPKAM